jgi:hypothetical protein
MDISRFKRDKSHNDWVNWLSDDPPEPEVKEKLDKSSQQQDNADQPISSQTEPPAVKKSPNEPNIVINLKIPKLKLPKPAKIKPPKLPVLPRKYLVIICVALAILGIFGYHWHQNSGSNRKTAQQNAQSANAQPSFKPAVPSNKPQLSSTGKKDTAYDSTRGVYSYSDALLGTSLTVSEQALPSNFKSADEAVASIAAQMGAKDKMYFNGGTAYMATDSKSNSQNIVASVNGLLILINSPFKHRTLDWEIYLNSLR